MKGDFSRLTFDAARHFRAVLLQQGRVQLDADWNEQVMIVDHLLRSLGADVIGGAAGADRDAFRLVAAAPSDGGDAQHAADPRDLRLLPGRYYVDGTPCENERECTLFDQPWPPSWAGLALPPGAGGADGSRRATAGAKEGLAANLGDLMGYESEPEPQETPEGSTPSACLAVLRSCLHHVLQVDDPSLGDVALGGLETASRLQSAWQVFLEPLADGYDEGVVDATLRRLRAGDQARPGLSVRHATGSSALENRLYRIEVHAVEGEGASFKWSRDNGSQAVRVQAMAVEAWIRDPRQLTFDVERFGDAVTFRPGQVVEFVGDILGVSVPLLRVFAVDDAAGTVVAEVPGAAFPTFWRRVQGVTRGILRLWDQEDLDTGPAGALPIRPGEWIAIENGIEVRFEDVVGLSRGDWWTFNTRAESGVRWPEVDGSPEVRGPQGPTSHLAPLAVIEREGDGWAVTRDLRSSLGSLTELRETIDAEAARVVELVQRTAEELRGDFREFDTLDRYRSEETLEPGDVVSRVSGTDDGIERATELNSRRVIGVVRSLIESTDGTTIYRVATRAEVPCKVRGNLQAGDMLVPSSVPGHARRCGFYIRPGTIVAKALESHESLEEGGLGVVRVLVTLT